MKLLFLMYFMLVLFLNSKVLAQDAAEEVVEVSTVEALLALVKEGKTKEQAANSERENKFVANKNKQASILAAEKRELVQQQKIADALDAKYKKNEEILRVKKEGYNKELGSLVELFGHLQSSAGETKIQLQRSVTSVEYGQDRINFLKYLTSKMSAKIELPSIKEIERLWYELTRELVASAQVNSFSALISDSDGTNLECEVIRVGLFNVICDGKYLGYSSSKKQYMLLPIQHSFYSRLAKEIHYANFGDLVMFGIDPSGPSGGDILSSLIKNQIDEECDILCRAGFEEKTKE